MRGLLHPRHGRYVAQILTVLFLLPIHILYAQCPTGDAQVIIRITPDSYPNETSWDLKDASNAIIASGAANSDTLCYPTGSLLKFTIYDSYGDGNCCGYGNGGYEIYLDGTLVGAGGMFAHADSLIFNFPPDFIRTTLLGALGQLMEHCNAISLLSPAELNAIAGTIRAYQFYLADDPDVVTAAFDVIDCYDANTGPLFLNAATTGGFPNAPGALDGFEYHRAIYTVQQELFDVLYAQPKISEYLEVLKGRTYRTSGHFPGDCPLPADSKQVFTTMINASMPTEWGLRTAWSSTPARRPTGYYLAPGTVGVVKVPAAMANKGFKILVGAHTYDHSNRPQVRRFHRVTNTFPITDTLTQIINPFGGGIYIITPYEADLGIVEVQLINVVPAPFFSYKTFSTTTLQEWLDVQRTNPAPWADFESDKFMMQVPRSWIYQYADPVTLMEDWDNRMDIVSMLLGHPLIRNNTILYLQVDLDIMHGFYGIGNPQINNTYDPRETVNGNKNHWFLQPGVNFWETEFHEMGHAQLFSTFPGETEAAVNVPAAAIYNRLYGMDIDTALGESFGNQPQITRDQAALNWMVTPNFRAGNPMDISNTTKDEVRYQQRGYAKYIEMAALFGWEVIDSFYRQEHLDYISQAPDDGLDIVDSRILRFSKIAGADLRPLIHFWGVHPKDSATLRTLIEAEELHPSKLICDRLTHYQSIIPRNNAEFAEHANAFFGGSVPPGGDPDYGSGWYNIWLPLYDESHGAQAVAAMQDIIDLYFPGGCPDEAAIPVVNVESATICAGDTVTLMANGASFYTWSNGAKGSTITVSPTETTTYAVTGKKAGYISDTTFAVVTVIPSPALQVTSDTLCQGESTTLFANGADTYLWSTGATGETIVVSPEENTTYSVTGTALGCSATAVSTVTVHALPQVDLGPDIAIPSGFVVTLEAIASVPDLTYHWSTGATTPSIEISTAGTYSVTVTTEDGCSATDSVVVNVITSSADPTEKYVITASPNPASDHLDITSIGCAISEIQVITATGLVVNVDANPTPDETIRRIGLAGLPAGLYYVRITGKDFTETIPVAKQ